VNNAPTLPPPKSVIEQMIDVRALAAMLSCSTRHVYRMHDAALMPPAVRLGALVRWRRQEIEEWIAGGCQPQKGALQ